MRVGFQPRSSRHKPWVIDSVLTPDISHVHCHSTSDGGLCALGTSFAYYVNPPGRLGSSGRCRRDKTRDHIVTDPPPVRERISPNRLLAPPPSNLQWLLWLLYRVALLVSSSVPFAFGLTPGRRLTFRQRSLTRGLQTAADSTQPTETPTASKPFTVRLHDDTFRGYKTETPSLDVEVNKDMLIDMYQKMTLMRRMEMAADALYRQKLIRGFCHLATGQVRSCLPLSRNPDR